VDVKRAADLYAQGRSLRQIGAELGVPWTAVSERRQAGVTMRRGGERVYLQRVPRATSGNGWPRPGDNSAKYPVARLMFVTYS
jgi:hypothetical protein